MKREVDEEQDHDNQLSDGQSPMNKRRRGNSESDEVRLLIPSKVRYTESQILSRD
jgi:hypothetical protein